MGNWLIYTDTQLFIFLNSFHSPFWDTIMWHISGKLEWLPLYGVLLYFIIRKYKWNSIAILLSIALIITLADTISSQLIKDNVQRLRPTHNPAISELIHTVNNYRGGRYGFVSSHASNSFAIAVFLSLLFKNKWFSVCIVLWALTVSYSRIYLGVHYPGDIIGGALLGGIIAFLIFKLFKFLEPKLQKINTDTHADRA